MRIKKIICLECNTILEVDFDKKNYKSFKECSCPNKTSLENYFTISQPGSIVRAVDKSKVKFQYAYNVQGAIIESQSDSPENWFYVLEPDNENTPKYTKWLGKLEDGGFLGGVATEFETDVPYTFNECRTYLKTNNVQSSDGRIYSLIKHLEDKDK